MKKLYTLLLVLFSTCSISFAQTTNTIATDSVYQTGPCAGSQVIVRFTTTGNFPVFGNTFTAQLSNAWGQFTNPVNIGTTNFNLGIMMATLPANATFGFLYRVRVVSTNPAITGTPSPNTVIITSNQFTATITSQGGTSICPGDSKTLQVLVPANSYLWSTGATTQSISVTQPGSYWVKVTDMTTCESRDTVEIVPGTNCSPVSASGDILNIGSLAVYPNPVSASGVLLLDGLPAAEHELQLLDITGRIQAKIQLGRGTQVPLSAYRLPAGLYHLMMFTAGNRTYTGRVVVME